MTYQGDTPAAGFYKIRMVRNGPFVPVRIWHGPSRDPVTGELLDRSHLWHAERRGRIIEIHHVWPWAGRFPIDEREYNYMLSLVTWADDHAPQAPEATPRQPVDFSKAGVPF